MALPHYSLGILMKAWPGSISSRMMRRISWSGSGKTSALEQSISKPVFSWTISAEVSYCGHTLDETHIISFEFYDGFETLENLAIDG